MSSRRSRCIRRVVALIALLGTARALRAQTLQYSIEGSGALGTSVSRIGDFDLDGCEDFVCGAEGIDAAVVYNGKTGALLDSITGKSGSAFGCDVDGKLDADGDGFTEVLIGAFSDDSNGSYAGRVVVYSLKLKKNLYALDGKKYSSFGGSVRSLQSDLDGDGIDDFIVGARGTDHAYVYSGATGALIWDNSGQTYAEFGFAVSRGGDMDGDGTCDYLVGSPFYEVSGQDVGHVAAFSGKTGKKLWSVDGPGVSSKFGWSIAEPGDLDGDGRTDCVVSAPSAYDTSINGYPGSVTAISGKTGAILYTCWGDADADFFGWSLRSASGDVDGDGKNDFIVGAAGGGPPYARACSGPSGATLYTYYEQTIDPSRGSQYGWSVAGGDFNGDGRTDALIGDIAFDTYNGLVEVIDTVVASRNNYGTGWPGTLGVPTITSTKNPVVGGSLTIQISDSASLTLPCLLLIGVASTSIPTNRGGTLLVVPALFVPISVPPAGLSLKGSIPDDPSLYGLHAYLQALEFDPGASAGVSFTDGLDLEFGWA